RPARAAREPRDGRDLPDAPRRDRARRLPRARAARRADADPQALARVAGGARGMTERMRIRPAVVIGGGWAGLAAAFGLTSRGIPVVLHESAPQLGGRARRVERAGLPIDNGQHMLVGAYASTRQ